MSTDQNLYTAAVHAAGRAPDGDLTAWLGRVGTIYSALVAQQQTLGDRLALIAKIEAPKEVRERGYGIAVGELVEVREEHGRGVLIVRPDTPSEFGDGNDTFRTAWLNDGGDQIVAEARPLIGQRVRVWKYPEAHSTKPGTTVRMCAQIAPAGPRREVPVASNGHAIDDEPF